MKSGPRTVALDSIVWREPSRPIDKDHVKDLAASIEEVGLLHRVGVVDLGDGKYEGRYGRHRYEAHRLLGRKEIDVEVLDLDGVGKELATIHENTKHLDMNPVQRARTFRRYAELRKAQDAKLTQEAIAGELQVSGPEFSNTVLLLDQDVHVVKLVEDGRLTPGHVEHALGPLSKTLRGLGLEPKEVDKEVNRFAHDIAAVPETSKPALDIRTAREQAKDMIAQVQGRLEAARLVGIVKAAKIKRCPACMEVGDDGAADPRAFREIHGRVILTCDADVQLESAPVHPEYVEAELSYLHEPTEADRARFEKESHFGHSWDAETGELYLTPKDKKEIARDEAAQKVRDEELAKAQAAVASRGKAKRAKAEKVLRDYAAFFARGTPAQWAQGLLEAFEKVGLREIRVGTPAHRTSWDADEGGLQVDEAKGVPLPQPLVVQPMHVADGKGGFFESRIQFGAYASLPSRHDNVGERADVRDLREERAKLLAFQRAFGVKQPDGDLWPVEVSGFQLGELVRLGAKTGGYEGQKGVILAFDGEEDGKNLSAVLDIARPTRHFSVSVLEKIPPKKAPSPTTVARRALREREPKKGKAKKTPKGRAK